MMKKKDENKKKDWLSESFIFIRDEIIPVVKVMWQIAKVVWLAFWYRLRYLWYKEDKMHVLLGGLGLYVGCGWFLIYLANSTRFTDELEMCFELIRTLMMYGLVLIIYQIRMSKTIKMLQSRLNTGKVGEYWKYYRFPIYIEEKWRNISDILNVSIDFSQMQIDNQTNSLKIKVELPDKAMLTIIKRASVSDELFKSCFLLPVINPDKRNVYVSVEGYIYLYVPALLEGRADKLIEYLKEHREYEELITGLPGGQNKQTKIEQRINEKIKSSDGMRYAQQLVDSVKKNKKRWKFNVVDVTGNNNYLDLHCRLDEYQTIDNVIKIKSEIESIFRSRIVIKETKDKRSMRVIVLVEDELANVEMTLKQLATFNHNQEFYIGESLTGPLSAKWNLQANHFWIAGMSGSGKSVQMKNILVQLAQMTDPDQGLDYRTMFLTSSSKVADFVEFGKAGALVASGIDKQIKVFEYVLEELEKREHEFYELEVENIEEANKRYPDLKMKQWILLADEYENTRNGLDKKKSEYAERLLTQILNVGRSAGCVVIIGTQSILKGSVGNVADKLTVKFSGYNEHNVWAKESVTIAKYYQTLEKQSQGVFFYKSQNLKPEQSALGFDGSYCLVQTPLIVDIEANYLPTLLGKHLEHEIFDDSDSIDDIDNGL
ncbi:hypothetical protein D1Z30_11670 [Enterococcus faecalis]|nr:hypothetical protein [Enterococcus faecalis]